jgi:hypothetical protein
MNNPTPRDPLDALLNAVRDFFGDSTLLVLAILLFLRYWK